jgi:hypothetical protein
VSHFRIALQRFGKSSIFSFQLRNVKRAEDMGIMQKAPVLRTTVSHLSNHSSEVRCVYQSWRTKSRWARTGRCAFHSRLAHKRAMAIHRQTRAVSSEKRLAGLKRQICSLKANTIGLLMAARLGSSEAANDTALGRGVERRRIGGHYEGLWKRWHYGRQHSAVSKHMAMEI